MHSTYLKCPLRQPQIRSLNEDPTTIPPLDGGLTDARALPRIPRLFFHFGGPDRSLEMFWQDTLTSCSPSIALTT